MAYIGNEPGTYYYSSSVEQFNGDGNEVNFNLTRSVGDAKDIEVLVNNVQQDPFSAYTASGSVLTFVEAPSVGVGNITVTHKAYNIWGMIPDATAVVPGSYGGTGITPILEVQADGRLTYAANISVYPTQAGNTDTVLFTNGTDTYWSKVRGTDLISNINIQSSNVTISNIASFTGPIYEKANVVSTSGLPSAVTIPTTDTGVLVYTGPSVANSTINFTGLDGVGVGNVATYTIILNNSTGSEKYISNVQIDGSEVYPKWAGEKPTFGQANTEYYSFVIIKTSATPTYNVLAQVTNFS